MAFKKLNREAVKYAAFAAMVISHAARILFNNGLLYSFLTGLGSFTAITMCYFLVEGYNCTRSKKKYAARLLLFAIISQVPYYAALGYKNLNMLFTLFLCFLICLTEDKIKRPAIQILLIVVFAALTLLCDWGVFAPFFTILFIWSGKSSARTKAAYIISTTLYFLCFLISRFESTHTLDIANALLTITGMALSGLCIIYFYSGKRAENKSAFSKWFFYIGYPAHLLIFALIRHFYLFC